jgi:hypothetical protein
MLCPLSGGKSSKEESSKYWMVDNIGESKAMTNVALNLTLENVKQVTSGLVKRTFRLKNTPANPDDKVDEKVIV